MSSVLEQSTPASARLRWQGTRSAFADLIRSVEGSTRAAGQTLRTLEVEAGSHSGDIASADDLHDAVTEAIWLASETISVTFYSEGADAANLTVRLSQPFQAVPALMVIYHGGTPRSRALVRMLVENVIPAEPVDPLRHWRWLGPLWGLLFFGTIVLIASRIPRIEGLRANISTNLKAAIWIVLSCWVLFVGCYWARMMLRYWFPLLERLPDVGETRWSRAKTWVGIVIGIWVGVVGVVLTFPPA